VGHQEGTREAKRCAHQGGDPIQFGISEFDFESNSESRTTAPSNRYIGCIKSDLDVLHMHIKRTR
jgi:hypothetical protein